MPRTPLEPVTTAQAAEMLGKSVRTVLRMADRGELPPAYKVPGLRGAYLFERAAVQRIAEQVPA